MIDIHCHILPQIDDGSDSIETSLAMARALLESGVDEVIATPHLPGLSLLPLKRAVIQNRYDLLCAALEKEGLPLKLHMSAEHNLDPLILQDVGSYLVPFGPPDARALLIELPWVEVEKSRLSAMIFELQNLDYTLVLAHPERSPGYSLEWLNERVSAGGFFLQIEANSLTGYYGKKAQIRVHELIDNHLAHFAASDSHDVTMCKDFGAVAAALQKELGEKAAKMLLTANPAALLAGQSDKISAI